MQSRLKAIILFATMLVFSPPAFLWVGRAEAGGWPLVVTLVCGSVAFLALLLLVYLGFTTALRQLKGK
jgi:hypothetical protein